MGEPSVALHKRAAYRLPVRTVSPSGLNATLSGPWTDVMGVPTGEPSVAFQSRAAFPPAVTRALPSGLNALGDPTFSSAMGRPKGVPSAALRSRPGPLWPRVRTVRPSGLTAR